MDGCHPSLSDAAAESLATTSFLSYAQYLRPKSYQTLLATEGKESLPFGPNLSAWVHWVQVEFIFKGKQESLPDTSSARHLSSKSGLWGTLSLKSTLVGQWNTKTQAIHTYINFLSVCGSFELEYGHWPTWWQWSTNKQEKLVSHLIEMLHCALSSVKVTSDLNRSRKNWNYGLWY